MEWRGRSMAQGSGEPLHCLLMKCGIFRDFNIRILGLGVTIFLTWSLVYTSLMFRIAPFELGWWDWLNIGLRSLVGPAIFVALVLAIGRRSLRLVFCGASSLVFFGVLGAYGLYSAWSGSVPHAAMALHGGEVREILPQVFHQLATGWLVLLVAAWIVQCVAVGLVPSRRLWSWGKACLVIILIIVGAAAHGRVARVLWDAADRVEARRLWVFDLNESVARFGILQSWWRDADAWVGRKRHPIDQEWPGTLTGRPSVPEGSVGRVRNVILVQVESLDPWVVEHEVRGRAVMPHLWALARTARVYPNFFAQHSGGGSSDAELALHLGVLPLATHSGMFSADWAVARPLPAIVGKRGWSTAVFHANRAGYFNRNVIYPQLAFERFFSEGDFTGSASGWQAIDADFMRQTLHFVDSMEDPFFASLITLQSHGPFRHHGPQPTVDPGPEASRLEMDYLQCMHEVDQSIGVLIDWLDRSGHQHDTAVVLFGDHLSRARGPVPPGPENIPLMVMAPSLEPGKDLRVGTHLDLGPTVLDLLGLAAPEGWLGTSMLDGGPGVAVFNNLEEVRWEDGHLVFRKNEARMPFLLYSATVLGQ